MAMSINQNLSALQALMNLNTSSSSLEKSIGKISSGLRITNAAEDPAGLCISEKMRSQINGLARARLNAQDGISMIQVAEGGLTNTNSILHRIRELALQSANGTYTSSDRLSIQQEVNELITQINEIAGTTEFNTKKLLNGSQVALTSSSSKYASAIAVSGGTASGDYNISLETVRAGISQIQRSGMLTDKNTGNAAIGSTKLEDIAEFYDSDGEFVLSDSTLITLTGNGNHANINLDSQMTLNEFAMTLQQSAISDSNGLGIKNTSVAVKQDLNGGTYLEVVSGVSGNSGVFSMIGSEALNSALAFSTTREAKDAYVKVTSVDSTGRTTSINTSGNRASNLLDGIDINFSSQAAQITGSRGIESGLNFTNTETIGLNLNGNSININIAAGKWSMDGLVRNINNQLTADANFADSGIKAYLFDGQLCIGYENSKTENSDFQIVSASETLGINTGTYNYSAIGNKNSKSIIEGISTYKNGANSDVVFNVNGISINAYTTTNNDTLPDLIESSEFETKINNQLNSADSDVIFNIISGSLAFTSKNVGDNKLTGSRSFVDIRIEDGSGNIDSETLDKFGFKSTYSSGSGESNFKIRVSPSIPTLQVGTNKGQTIDIPMGDMSAMALGIMNIDLTTISGAKNALSKLNRAMEIVSSETSLIGSYQNRLTYTMNNLQTAQNNITSAESRIRDVDVASEIMEYMKNQIKSQAGTAMLAQANSGMGNVLKLLGL